MTNNELSAKRKYRHSGVASATRHYAGARAQLVSGPSAMEALLAMLLHRLRSGLRTDNSLPNYRDGAGSQKTVVAIVRPRCRSLADRTRTATFLPADCRPTRKLAPASDTHKPHHLRSALSLPHVCIRLLAILPRPNDQVSS